jgi:beta-fructofuranosidase
LSVDHHFPRYHVRPPTGFVNDPNGPVRIGDRWHLFFQYSHDTARTGSVVWGHASSADLATWSYHRPALSPHPGGPDRNGCWSGNTVLCEHEVVAFYSGSRNGHPYQSVLLARSADGGESFGVPVQVVDDPEPAVAEFRDPFVWRENGGWSMVVGAGSRGEGPSARLYTSEDLEKWEYRGPYAAAAPTPELGEMWECPQVASFGSRDALLVSAYEFGAGGPGRVIALTGGRTEYRLVPEHSSLVDHGPNFYAASVLRDGGDGPIVWGWVTEGRAGEWAREADWSGMISLPRVLSLRNDGRIASTPVDSLATLRSSEITSSEISSTGIGLSGGRFEGVPAQFEALLELSGRRDGVTRMSLGTAAGERVDVLVDWAAGRITIDRERASLDPRADRGAHSFEEPLTGGLSLRWFVDGSVGELFTGSGRVATFRFYPTAPPPWTLEVDGVTAADAIRVWRLGSG